VKPYYESDDVTLFHGDCREIVASMEDASVDLVLTDPPYGHNNNDGDLIANIEAALGRGPAQEGRPITNDGPEANELALWLFAESARLLRPGCCCCCCCCCCCGGGGPDPQFARWSMWMDDPLQFKQMVVWDKGPMGLGWHYRRSYETVLVAQKRGGPCKWYDETGTIENIIRHIPKLIPSAEDHPTPKPVALLAHFLRLHTATGDLVLDPFAGSGTTLVASRLLGRRCIGVEIDERWCELAARRLSQETFHV